MKFSKIITFHLLDNYFFLLQRKVVFVLFLLFQTICYSQETEKKLITLPEIENEFQIINDLLEKKTSSSILQSLRRFNEIERKVIQSENSDNILYFYLNRTETAIDFNDHENAKYYTKKGKELALRVDDKRYLGLFYELEAVIDNYQNKYRDTPNKFVKRDKLFIKADSLLSKYGSDADNVDPNFNLALMYKDKQDWDKVYYYASKSKELIAKSNQKEDRICFLNIFLAESLVYLNQLERAKFFLDEAVKDKSIIEKNEKVLSRFYYANGLYYEKMLDFKTAASNFLESNRYNFLLLKKENKQTNDFMSLKDSLEIIKNENLKIANENLLNKENIKYKNYSILLTLLVILILGSMLFFLKKNLRYKLETNIKLEENNKELKKVNKQIKQAVQEKKFFLDTITHELRTPLNTMKGVSYLLNNTTENNEQEYLDTINFSSDYLLKLVNNMIDFNSFDKNKKPILNNEIVDLERLLENSINAYRIKECNKNEFIFNHDKAISNKLIFDKFRITQILINLLDNANKFTENGEIVVKTKLLKSKQNFNTIEFFIQDSGIGIDKKTKEKIFDLFYQGSKEINRKYGGSGIGLSIVKKTIELYESDIVVNSDLGKGTTISFILNFEIAKE